MLKRNRKRFACMHFLHNDNGHTLLSMLFALAIFSLTIPFLAMLISNTNYTSNYNMSSVQHFFHIIRDDLLHSPTYAIKKNKIYLSNFQDQEITIEHYGSLIRRQVNGLGHEIYLRQVENVTFKKLPYGLHATVTLNGGETYEKSIIFYE